MLGDKIKNLRIKKDFIQEELANNIGLSQSTIGMIEKNKQVEKF